MIICVQKEVDVAVAVKEFIKICFFESNVLYKERALKPKVGIPTGGSLCRQIADAFLHGVLFKKIRNIMNANEMKFWKRFIDDGIAGPAKLGGGRPLFAKQSCMWY